MVEEAKGEGRDGRWPGRKEAQMRSRSSHVFPLTDRASLYAIERGRGAGRSGREQAGKCHPPFSALELPVFRFSVRPRPSGPSISITSSHPWAMAVSEEPSCGWAVAQKWKGLGYEIAGLCAAPPVVLLSQRKRDRLDGKRETHPRTIFKAKRFLIFVQASQ